MNYDHLFIDGQFPIYYRKIAIPAGILAIVTGLFLKISGTTEIIGITDRHLKFVLLISLINILFSKDKRGDERTLAIQLQLFKLGFRTLLMLIVLMELGVALNFRPDIYKMFYYFVIGIIGSIALIYEISKESNYADIAEKYSVVHRFILVFTATFIVIFNMWLW